MTNLKTPDTLVVSPNFASATDSGAIVIPAPGAGHQIIIGSAWINCLTISGVGSDAVCLHGMFGGQLETIPGTILSVSIYGTGAYPSDAAVVLPGTGYEFSRGLACDDNTPITFAVIYGTLGHYRPTVSYRIQ